MRRTLGLSTLERSSAWRRRGATMPCRKGPSAFLWTLPRLLVGPWDGATGQWRLYAARQMAICPSFHLTAPHPFKQRSYNSPPLSRRPTSGALYRRPLWWNLSCILWCFRNQAPHSTPVSVCLWGTEFFQFCLCSVPVMKPRVPSSACCVKQWSHVMIEIMTLPKTCPPPSTSPATRTFLSMSTPPIQGSFAVSPTSFLPSTRSLTSSTQFWGRRCSSPATTNRATTGVLPHCFSDAPGRPSKCLRLRRRSERHERKTHLRSI
mmetsp:Transcript_57950/g.136571  ORF Transcript_57950/g.136571 Transcript_57950/m.136571 type:complete len:263 (-) Transcript_57950:665-1453(-)